MTSPYHTILVAYDGTDASDIALRQGADLAQSCKAQLHVMAIVVTGGGLPAERQSLLDAMTAAIGDLGAIGSSVLTCVREGEAAVEIGAYAREIKADLVVLGHNDQALGAMVPGRHLLGQLPCSALVAIREPQKPGDSPGKGNSTTTTGTQNCSAVVLWLPPGEKPNDIDHFNVAARLHSAERTLDACWSLEQAISHVQGGNDHGKQPWIKVSNIVLSPVDICDLSNFYKHHGTRK